jgi:AcrR family transcriptional regulator
MTPEETRVRIVQSAAQAFASRGFRASSIKTIARLAHVNEVTVYRHFPKKTQLYWDAIEWKLNNTIGAPSAIRLQPNAAPREMLRNIAISILESLDKDPDLSRLIYFTVLELERERGRVYEAHLKPLLILLQEQVCAWIRRGWVREIDPETAALSIAGILISHSNFYTMLGARPTKLRSREEIATECANICFDGLRSVF